MSEVEAIEKSDKNLIYSVLIVLIYAGIIAFFVGNHPWDFHSSKQSLTWIQPQNSAAQPLISPDNSKVDFGELEKTLGQIQFNDSGDIALNTTTANILKEAVSHIPSQATDKEVTRIQFLIEKIHPQHEQTQLTDIVFKYREYDLVASIQTYRKNRAQNLKDAERHFKEDLKLKEQFLGKNLSDALFTSKHKMTYFVLESKRILNNMNLTSIEKEKSLIALSKKLKS